MDNEDLEYIVKEKMKTEADEYERALRIDLEKPPFVSVDWDEFSIAIHKLIRAGELLYLDNTVENKINWIWCDQEIRRVNLGRPRIKS